MTKHEEAGRVNTTQWEEALSWYVNLREGSEEDLTNTVGREWEYWYSDAENRRIFENLSRLLAESELYRKRRRLKKAELDADRYDPSISIAEWRKTQVPFEEPKRRLSVAESSRCLLPWALAVAAFGAIVSFIVLGPLRISSGLGLTAPVVYQTGIGEIRDVHLHDGSKIILGGRTKLSVAFSAQHRSVDLIDGQAWFTVAHNPHWPFIVTAGEDTVTAVGTAFLVTRDSDRVVVTVTEGIVEVSALPPGRLSAGSNRRSGSRPRLRPIHVSRGEELAFGSDGALGPAKPTDIHAATAWTHGRLIFDDQPLRYVIETVDRYSSRHIVVTSSAGELRFSGIVHHDEIEDWLQGLRNIFPVSIEERGSAACIYMRNATSSDWSCMTRP